jgi:hypothetical protein
MAWFMDLELSRRLERTEAAIATTFIPVQQRIAPARGADWHDFDGTYAIYDGVDSPLSQTIGLGLFGPTTPEQLADLEAYFGSRKVPVMHEVSPLAGVEPIALLASRGYVPCELSTVLIQELDRPLDDVGGHALRARVMTPADRATWVETSIAGWVSDPTFSPMIRSIAEVASHNDTMIHFLAERDGEPLATGSLGIHGRIALLAGASTVVAGRGQGAQARLLAARLAEAQRRGCELAMMVTAPGSASQRNAERRGFRVAYTRTKWRLAAPA